MANLKSGTITTNTTTDAINFRGGNLYIGATGAFGAGTLSAQVSYNGGVTYIAIPESGMTADDTYTATLPDCYVRLSLASSSGASINWFMSEFRPV